MKHLYTAGEAQRWRRRASLVLFVSLGAVAAALTTDIVLCTRVSTGNAQQLLLWVIALFTLAGWAAILLLWFVYVPAKAQAEHIGGMLAEEPQLLEGVLTIHRESFHIPRSVTVRKATLVTVEGEKSLHISAALARQLPAGGGKLRLMTVRRFITGFEVIA
ncbi:MAG: hypothetical protein IKK57_05145 [Clostridia bacterium]|nr:hypothetical protein [Clostridia bacterium]